MPSSWEDEGSSDVGVPGHSQTKESLSSPRYSLVAAEAAAGLSLPPEVRDIPRDPYPDTLTFPAVSPIQISRKQLATPPLPSHPSPDPIDKCSILTPSSTPPLTDVASDAYDSVDEVQSIDSTEKESAPFNSDSDNDVGWINQPKSPTSKLFETLKIQMEQTDFSSANDEYTDSRFIDAPLPLMDFPATPINREWEVSERRR